MSIKSFFKEREKKFRLLTEIKDTILDKNRNYKKLLLKNGLESNQEILKIFISQGHQVYSSGDLDTFEFFIKSLFEIYQEPNNDCKQLILNEIRNFGLMSAHHHNHNAYNIILENYEEYLILNVKNDNFKHHLNIIRNFALIALANNYVEGVLGVVNVYQVLNQYLEDNNMVFSNIYLKNAIINLIYLAEKYEKDDIKGQILPEIYNILKHKDKEAVSINRIKESVYGNIPEENKETIKYQDLEA